MLGAATDPLDVLSPTSSECPHGLDFEGGSVSLSPTHNHPFPDSSAEVKETLSHPYEESSSVLPLLKPCQDEPSKEADAGFSISGKSKDAQEHQSTPNVLDPAHIAKLLKAINRLLHLQNKATLKRSEVRELRIGLKYEREEEAEKRAQLIRNLTSLVDQDSVQPLIRDIDALRSATGKYSDLETEYHEAEDQLDRDELVLINAMEHFARLSHNHSLPTPEETSLMEQDNLSYVGSTTSLAAEDPPDVMDYLSRVADLRIVQERLHGLYDDLRAIQHKREERRRLNIPMDEESLDFLESYDEEWSEINQELIAVQSDVDQLRAVCSEKGHFTDEYVKGRDFEHEVYPAALQYPAPEYQPQYQPQYQPEYQRVDPLKASTEEDTSPFVPIDEEVSQTRFINKWLLHRLRQSNLEIGQLKSLPEIKSLRDQGYDDRKVSQLSLKEWFKDEATMSPPPPPSTSGMGNLYDQGPALTVNNRKRIIRPRSYSF
ncbi:hypothetical protein BBP40_006361 [Aspergillus hancockii]|nr:hypothetical protein BBP40_006361 [Aspergillus hancockii]